MMMNQLINKLDELTNWKIEKYDGNYISFQQYTPEGQDFSIELSAETCEELSEQIYDYYLNYDESEETMLWLDESGHGINGAPYMMTDILEDMRWCKEQIYELSKLVCKLIRESKYA